MNPYALAHPALNSIELVEAVERRNVNPLISWLEKRIQTSFQLQGREFLKRFAKKRGTWPLQEATPPNTPLSQFEDDLEEVVEAAAAEIAANLDIAATKGLVQGGQTLLSQLGGSGGGSGRALASLAIRFDLRSPRAIAYLKNYGARQVTGVSETTKTRIRNLLVQGLEERWSYAEMASRIQSRFKQMAFGVPQHHIRSRAELIAVTEVGNAFEEGSMVGALQLEAAGRVMQKRWLDTGDDRVDGNCQANSAMGWVGLNETYANGEDRPLDHPACRCSLAYRVVRNVTPKVPTVH